MKKKTLNTTLLQKSCQKNTKALKLSANNKTVINHKFDLDKSIQEILYRIDNWINEGSGWIVESIKPQYINISTFKPLIGSS